MSSKSGMSGKIKVFRVVTVPVYMNLILKGQMKFLAQYFDVTGITSDDGFHYPQIAEREGITTRIVPFRRDISIKQDVRCLWLLIKEIRREKPSLVHTQTPKGSLLGMLAAWICGVPVRIHSVTGVPLGDMEAGIKGKILRWMEAITFRCATHVVPNSQGVFAQLQHNSYLKKTGKMRFLGHGSTNGIQLDRFVFDENTRSQMRDQWNIAKDDLVLGFVGRLAKDKGSVELLTAFKQLKQKHPQLKLICVGLFDKDYGELGASFEKEIKETEGVILAGRQADVVPFYSMMDILVHPSYREGLPNALLEAAAMGLPVISTKISGCNEVVEDGVTGDLIPPRDTLALQDAIDAMVQNPQRRLAMKVAARNRVEARYNQELVWQNWKEFYDETLASVR